MDLVDKCQSLQDDCPYVQGTWLSYIYQGIKENMADNKMETAENALNFGQYELALDIYLQEGKEQQMIDYCRGKVWEQRKDYHQALLSYEKLPASWFSQGRRRKTVVSLFCESWMQKAEEAWKYKYGKVAGFYEALFEALTAYETSRKAFASWRNDILEQVETMEDACRQKMQKIGRGKYVV